MTRHSQRPRAVPTEARSEASVDTDRVVARPDGYYWVADGGRQEFGPFPTAAQAAAAAREAVEATQAEAETLQQAEEDIGVPDRINHDVVEVDEQTPSVREDR